MIYDIAYIIIMKTLITLINQNYISYLYTKCTFNYINWQVL
jgi:hypothetical protein